jgi:hypothetical protein
MEACVSGPRQDGREGTPMDEDASRAAERARRAFARAAKEIAALGPLTISELQAKHIECYGIPSPVRSRAALMKRLAIALQRRADKG